MDVTMNRRCSALAGAALWPLLALLTLGCRGSTPARQDAGSCPAVQSRRHILLESYDTRFTVVDGVVRITGEGSGALLGQSFMAADETPRMGAVPNRLTGTAVLIQQADTLRLSYDVISSPPQPASEIRFSGPFEITGGAGKFRCAAGSGTMSGSANLPMRTGRNVFEGVILTPATS